MGLEQSIAAYSVVPEGSITTPKGFTAGGLHCGLKNLTAMIWALSSVKCLRQQQGSIH